MLRVVLRAEQAVLLSIPERDEDRPPRVHGLPRDAPGDRQRGRDSGRVVGGAVADRVRRVRCPAPVPEVVVVRTHQHVLTGEIGPRDHGQHIGSGGERLRVRVVTGPGRVGTPGDGPQLVDQVLPGDRGTRRRVVPTRGLVAGELRDVEVGAPGQQRRERQERHQPGRHSQHSVERHAVPPPPRGRRPYVVRRGLAMTSSKLIGAVDPGATLGDGDLSSPPRHLRSDAAARGLVDHVLTHPTRRRSSPTAAGSRPVPSCSWGSCRRAP